MRASEQKRPDVALAREQWQAGAPLLDRSRLVFLDETGAKTNMTRLYGRSARGQRVIDHVPSGHWNTTTLIAAVRADGPRAPMLLAYVEQVLVPTLREGDMLVMDNLSTHKNSAARRLIEAAGVRILDLPAYSPDLNPIEKMWSKMKASVRAAAARTQEALQDAIARALAAVTASDIDGWFQSCGYNIK